MRMLDVQARLERARATVVVLRALRIIDATMTCKDFAIAIGMITEKEKWEVWHKNQVATVLRIARAAEMQGRSADTALLEFHRVVKAADRKPGKGLYKTTRIVSK